MATLRDILQSRVDRAGKDPPVTMAGGSGGGVGVPDIPEEEDVAILGVANLTFSTSINLEVMYSTSGLSARLPLRRGTISNFKVNVPTNTRTDATTVEVLVNGVGAILITVPAGVTGIFEAVGTSSPAATFAASFRVVTGPGTGIISMAAAAEYKPT